MNEDYHSSITQLGLVYGMTRVEMGRVLKNHELRDESGQPTREGLDHGKWIRDPNTERPFFVWNRRKMMDLLDNMGYERRPFESPVEEELGKPDQKKEEDQ